MAKTRPRVRKRVYPLRRAPDGSAFQNCEYCGVSVAIAIADIHECEPGKDVKRFKGPIRNQVVKEQRIQDLPRSPFCFFMEGFVERCEVRNGIEIDREGFEAWRNMSQKERLPYILQAEKVDLAYRNALLEKVGDEADSAEVGRYDQNYEPYPCTEYTYDSDGFLCSWFEGSESFYS
ncbi:uncharacterized protein LOC127795616 isoform X2 [Diospyros lotus]|uniref:uncharacterized protein LOC127795616 isoform X2 n=1 Tax=Diospyros lotus TaxID=55363 RepID=UPI00224E2BDB|nr:uncharacterized protein LOC127795616 isoform X2 [Diospyros lotus]